MPTKVYLRRTISGFVPDTDEDREAMSRVKLGQVVKATYTIPRSQIWHRKGFAFLKATFDLQDYFEDFDQYRKWLTMKAGFYTTYVAPDSGTVILEAKSLAFDSMDETEFKQCFQKMITAFTNSLISGNLTVKDVQTAWDQAMDFA